MSAALPYRPPSPVSPCESDGGWQSKLHADALAIRTVLPARTRPLHRAIVIRAREQGAEALVLSGSTARGRRTDISDLDYHVIGSDFEAKDISRELDLHFLSREALCDRVRKGDDFVHWSLRFGLVAFDEGPIRKACGLIAKECLWPDVSRKRDHAAKSLEMAHRFIDAEDQDGAVEQARTALSLSARAYLLSAGIFPLSRAELPDQLREQGRKEAAARLEATIFAWPSLSELEQACVQGDALLRESVRVIDLASRRV